LFVYAVFVTVLCSMLRYGFGSSSVAASSSSAAGPGAGEGGGGTGGSRHADNKFIKMLRRELEGDSVDTEILDEELRFLRETEPKT